MGEALEVVAEPERAAALLHPARRKLLEALDGPLSAAALASRLSLPRQRVNYHLRELFERGLVEVVEERSRGSCTERTYRRSSQSFTISDEALGSLGRTPDEIADRFSSAYQIALASRTVRELGRMRHAAKDAGKSLPTLALDAEVRFASPEARHAFAEELSKCIAQLVARYHDSKADGGRPYRLMAGAYPRPKED
jgi:DNA-binding transcriptional ArsR family regulator